MADVGAAAADVDSAQADMDASAVAAAVARGSERT
jgi:hypothetical protein